MAFPLIDRRAGFVCARARETRPCTNQPSAVTDIPGVLHVNTCTDWSDFVDPQAFRSGKTMFLLLEHEPIYSVGEIQALFEWGEEDCERIGRFRHEASRTSWCISRLLARHALSLALNLPAGTIKFFVGPWGKPYLEGYRIYFNWSHAPGCVALAVSIRGEIGCDVEDISRPISDMGEITSEHFRENESNWIHETVDDASRRARFFSLFTQKEAFLKREGFGLSMPLSQAVSWCQEPPFYRYGTLSLSFGTSGSYIAALCEGNESIRTPVIRYIRLDPATRFPREFSFR